ncbi:MAG: response regulator transcription factor [Bacteroidota bacterium]
MTKAISPIHILLVDDEPDILEFLTYGLRKEGYKVSSARNGREAVCIARTHKPDLIVLDLMMPEWDGIATYKQLKKLPNFQHVLITFLTAKDEGEVKQLSQQYNIKNYILKPVRPATFFLRIQNLLVEEGKIKGIPVRQLNVTNQISLNRLTHEFIGQQRHCKLTKREFETLWLLANKPGQIFTAEEIRRHLYDKFVTNELEVAGMISWLKQKIGGQYIQAVEEFGYKFVC